MQRIKKTLSYTIVIALIFTQSALPTLALEAPTAPSAPSAPTNEHVAPVAPTAPTAPTSPSSSTSNDSTSESTGQDEPTSTNNSSTNQEEPKPNDSGSNDSNWDEEKESDGNGGTVGDTFIETGDATNDASISTLGNNNLASDGTATGTNGVSVANIGNGSESDNDASVNLENNSDTTQDNSASVGNNLSQNSNTGTNDASKNVGDSTIKTGDANTSGAILTSVNTNLEGVSVSQFQVDDVHTGDLVLDFAANCIINCGGNISAKNTGNGSESDNNAEINALTNDNTFQNNDATVENNLILASNSGNNTASENTGGDSFIQTGDANVSGNVLTFANNNFSGNVIYGIVDIFGTLDGDIILTEEAIAQVLGYTCFTCTGDVSASNTGNGTNSDNDASVNQETNNTTLQNNDATIENNLKFNAQTGDNTASQNTGGDSLIQTGNSSIESQTINIANSNIEGGNWWLVIVNKAGQWVGQLIGAPTGSLFAGSSGTDFQVSDTGEITATNSGNGANSNNNAEVNQESNTTTTQNNNANIVNNIDLSANTGGNEASRNTGGSSTVKTGDAKVIANLVNFVNNNVIGGGKLVVTVVNVFGNWFGDFVTPGHQKNNENNHEENNGDLASNTQNVGSPSLSESSNSNSENHSSEPSHNNNSNNDSNANNETIKGTISLASALSDPANPSFPSNSPNPSSQILKVAGVSNVQIHDVITDANKNNSKTKGVSINLAWILVLLPIALTYIAVRKKFNPLKLLLRKTN